MARAHGTSVPRRGQPTFLPVVRGPTLFLLLGPTYLLKGFCLTPIEIFPCPVTPLSGFGSCHEPHWDLLFIGTGPGHKSLMLEHRWIGRAHAALQG